MQDDAHGRTHCVPSRHWFCQGKSSIKNRFKRVSGDAMQMSRSTLLFLNIDFHFKAPRLSNFQQE